MRVLVPEIVQRDRQAAGGPAAWGNDEHLAPVEEKPESICGREVVIELDAELVPRIRVDGVA